MCESSDRQAGGELEITPAMIEAGSRYLCRELGPHKDVAYGDVVEGLILAVAAQALIGHGYPGLWRPKK